MRKKILFAAFVVSSSHVVVAATLKPIAVERFFVAPDEPGVLRWHVESGTLSGPVEAIDALGRLNRSIEDPDMRSTVNRMIAAVRILSCDSPEDIAVERSDPDDPVWDLALLEAAKGDDRAASAVAAGLLNRSVRSASWKSALCV